MASRITDSHRRGLLFPIGALIFSEGIDGLIRQGRLDPIPFFQRHTRGDWGDVSDHKWQENNAALKSSARLDSFYVVTRDLKICVFTEADRSATHIVLPSEY
ncbi:hypothetical protein HK44_021375 [Pseudomonas fluorescens HK44]|uniref:O-methyl transferase family domain-containing protein n=1 Tax=Pseudomonas fluorescens HK44 TaxID=1042209 RepID=A0A010S5U5_PSEFL|nr:hypothetical protein [Pseudomonas fluorescens]EXF95914.1 hypothetical protein HK44_021375 [Pseudomonas fluorescens HK44]